MTKKPVTSTRSRQATRAKSNSPPTIDTSKLPDQLKDLRLPTFRELHVRLADQAAREQWTHTQYLAHLVDQECQSRYQSRIVRLTRDAHLLAGKTWEEFQWSRVPLHVTQQFETLRQGNFLDRQDNVLIFGRPGSGKTMLLSALGDQLVKKGRPVFFATCQMLVQELLRAKRDLRLERVIKKLHKFDALIIDDLGVSRG
jgi:DNA replication protein DnaC